LDAASKRIGVELVQRVNQQQMAESKAQFKREDSYRLVILCSFEQPPAKIGLASVYARDKTILATPDAAAFRKELYDFVARIDADWLKNPESDDPQG
jgi:hypothetical protein